MYLVMAFYAFILENLISILFVTEVLLFKTMIIAGICGSKNGR